MSHSGGMQATEIAFVSGEQQIEATGMTWPQRIGRKHIDTLLTTHFFKNKISITNLHYVKYYFCL